MNKEVLYTLEMYYYSGKEKFLSVLAGNGITSSIYKKIVSDILIDVANIYRTNAASIVRLDMDGNLLFSDTSSKFANSKKGIKTMPSSVNMIGNDTIIVADSVNKTAKVIAMSSKGVSDVIINMYYETPSSDDVQFVNDLFASYNDNIPIPSIIWQYASSNYITDFQLVPSEDITIEIKDDSVTSSYVSIRQGCNVIWENNSSIPVTIYSGTTTYDEFQLNPDLNLYGKVFKSSVLQVGERYSFKFVNVGEYGFFIYPDIFIGKVSVTRNRISSRDQFIILENDGLEGPFSSRVIKVDCYGNILWTFGESYLAAPRDSKPLLNGGVLIST